MYSTRLTYMCKLTRAYLTDILARKIARVGQVGGQVGEDRRVSGSYMYTGLLQALFV